MRSEGELWALARGGDAQASEELVLRYAPLVLRWARARCRDPRDGEDVAQETLLAAFRGLHDVEGDGLAAWLRAITRNTCARFRRRRAGAPEVFAAVDETEADPARLPEESAQVDEARERLGAALATLDARQREVLVLRDVEGLTAPEVGELLGLGVDAVKSRLHRARAALRAAMAPAPQGPGCPDIASAYSRYLEGELDGSACDALHAHVMSCSSCDASCRALADAVGACRTMVDPTPEVAARLRASLRHVLGR